MAQMIQRSDINKITSLANNQSVTKHHPKLENHEPSQEVLDSSTVTKEIQKS